MRRISAEWATAENEEAVRTSVESMVNSAFEESDAADTSVFRDNESGTGLSVNSATPRTEDEGDRFWNQQEKEINEDYNDLSVYTAPLDEPDTENEEETNRRGTLEGGDGQVRNKDKKNDSTKIHIYMLAGSREHRSDSGHWELQGDRGRDGLHRRQGPRQLEEKKEEAIRSTFVQYFKTDVYVFFHVQFATHAFIICFFYLMNKYVFFIQQPSDKTYSCFSHQSKLI